MRIVSWNVAHQTRERPMPNKFGDAIRSLNPDVLILNEYVHGSSRDGLTAQLSDCGLSNIHVSVRIGTNNQVLIASRRSVELGELRGIPTKSGGGESNFLHVRMPDADLEIIGMRVPSYSGKALAQYWDGFTRLTTALRGRRCLLAGDLNVDPEARSAAAKVLRDLRDSKDWRLPAAPKDQWSFKTGSRIDHALATPGMAAPTITYCKSKGDLTFCDLKAKAMSDHTPLIIELPV